VTSLVDLWGRLDVVVANAVQRGPRRDTRDRFEDVPESDWLPVLDTNLTGAIRLLQRAVAVMRPRGWGRIVLVSSHNALAGGRGQEFYGAAKAGLHGLSASLAWDLGADGIMVNVVCPGLTETEKMLSKLPLPVRKQERELTPTGRLSMPDAIADAIVFLCSAANGNISGEALTISGGR
jgi:3-oxoacyl-[acyl-carrier protein] reductase